MKPLGIRNGGFFIAGDFRTGSKVYILSTHFDRRTCGKKPRGTYPQPPPCGDIRAPHRSIFMPFIDAKNNPTARDWGRTRGIRAIRFADNREECEKRLAAFGLFARTLDASSTPAFALRIARALRAERRAAQGKGSGYDPMRHLVLARLDRRLRRSAPKSGAPTAL
jgi:hypothetical protein